MLSGDVLKIAGETLFQDNDENDDKINAASGPISEVTQIRDNFYKLSLLLVLMKDLTGYICCCW